MHKKYFITEILNFNITLLETNSEVYNDIGYLMNILKD